MNVLIIDDNIALCNALKKNFVHKGFAVECANDGKAGLREALENKYDVILLDIMMPQMDGYTVLRKLRSEGRNTPVLMLTARDTASDKIESLELGADDYVQKPFNMDILYAKIKALARRSSIEEHDSDTMRYYDITLDLQEKKLQNNGLQVTLTSCECETLKNLISYSSVIVDAGSLADMSNIPGRDEGKLCTVIESLTKMLKYICSEVQILNIKGIGYKLCCSG